jgi:hypothetical protein
MNVIMEAGMNESPIANINAATSPSAVFSIFLVFSVNGNGETVTFTCKLGFDEAERIIA